MKSNNIKTLVEDCYKLELSHFPRGFHHKDQCTGEFNIQHNQVQIPVLYGINNRRIDPYIKICFKKNGKYRWQNINFDIGAIKLGVRSFLLCDCGHRANKLYLPPNGDRFMCAKCWDLRYLTQTISRQVLGSDFFYYHSRLTKLENYISSLKRVKYAGKPTARVQSIAKMAVKWAPDISTLKRMQEELAQITSK